MKFRPTNIILVPALSLVCSAQSTDTKLLSEDEKAIYELLLSSYSGDFIVSPNLDSYGLGKYEELWQYLKTSTPNIHQAIPLTPSHRAAYLDLISKCKSKHKIQQWCQKIKVGIPTDEEFSHRSPITIFHFSPIGFDKNGTVAIVIRGGSQGPDAGSGECYVLAKTEKGWSIQDELTLWIS